MQQRVKSIVILFIFIVVIKLNQPAQVIEKEGVQSKKRIQVKQQEYSNKNYQLLDILIKLEQQIHRYKIFNGNSTQCCVPQGNYLSRKY